MGLNIKRRALVGNVVDSSLHPVLQRIYQGREVKSVDALHNSAKGLLHFKQLSQCEDAAKRVANAIAQSQPIVIIGDFDADGATSTAVCMLALKAMGATVTYLVPNRFDFGYGLSPEIVELAAQQVSNPLIITVDNGISCVAGVATAKALGLDVVITDHHLPGEVLPEAVAIVNPNQTGCDFPSKNLAGVGVAFYLMLALRAELEKRSWFTQQSLPVPNLANLLDLVALGTVADVVVLDHNNRILVYQGLQRIRAGQCRPGITALFAVAQRQPDRIIASDLGFVIGPRLNAAGRLDDMAAGIECLLSDDVSEARAKATELDRLNQQRRSIEQQMKAQALDIVANIQQQMPALMTAMVIYDERFHQGVIGIVAGRLKDEYKRPVIVFAKQDETTLKGSARSITGVHIRDVIEAVNTANPGIICKFGGHAAAAGLSINTEQLAQFTQLFNQQVELAMVSIDDPNVLLTDGPLAAQDLDISVARVLRSAGPFGQGFPTPLFDGEFRLVQQRIVGEKHLKMVVVSTETGEEFDAIAFNVDPDVWPNPSISVVQLAYQLDINYYRGKESLQLLVEALSPL